MPLISVFAGLWRNTVQMRKLFGADRLHHGPLRTWCFDRMAGNVFPPAAVLKALKSAVRWSESAIRRFFRVAVAASTRVSRRPMIAKRLLGMSPARSARIAAWQRELSQSTCFFKPRPNAAVADRAMRCRRYKCELTLACEGARVAYNSASAVLHFASDSLPACACRSRGRCGERPLFCRTD